MSKVYKNITIEIDKYINAFNLLEEAAQTDLENINRRKELFKYLLDDLNWIQKISQVTNTEDSNLMQEEIFDIINYINKETEKMIEKDNKLLEERIIEYLIRRVGEKHRQIIEIQTTEAIKKGVRDEMIVYEWVLQEIEEED